MAARQSVRRVQQALADFGIVTDIVEFPQTTRTSAQAAEAIGCVVGQIAKSLVFRTDPGGAPILVLASGSNRVDERKLAALVGEDLRRPDAVFVRETTGFAIGGVPPIGHARRLATYIDEDLMALEEIWAAAGSPNAVFRTTPQELAAMTQGRVADIKKA